MRVIPLLRFKDQAAEAFGFYARVLGGRITACLRYADLASPGDAVVPDYLRNHVCHIRLELPGAVLVGADGTPEPELPNPAPINLEVDSVIEAERLYRALGEGGQEQLPMMETAWAWRWGWLVDRYGTAWMVQCPKLQRARTGLPAGRTG